MTIDGLMGDASRAFGALLTGGQLRIREHRVDRSFGAAYVDLDCGTFVVRLVLARDGPEARIGLGSEPGLYDWWPMDVVVAVARGESPGDPRETLTPGEAADLVIPNLHALRRATSAHEMDRTRETLDEAARERDRRMFGES